MLAILKDMVDTVPSSGGCLCVSCIFHWGIKVIRVNRALERGFSSLCKMLGIERKVSSRIPALRSSSPPSHLSSVFAFLSLSFELISQPVSVNHCCQNSSCTEASTEWSYPAKHQLNVAEICRKCYWQGDVTPLASCLLFHFLRPVVFSDTAELTAWLPSTVTTDRPRNLPFIWNESQSN